MTDQEFNELCNSLSQGSKMLLQRLERGARSDENVEISLTTLGEYADIMKDISEVIKNLSKAHHYRSKYSTKML
jgi:hypothetical protein